MNGLGGDDVIFHVAWCTADNRWLLYLVKQVIWQGPLSGPVRRRPPTTLEPRGVFGFARYWPGLALMALGGIILLAGAALLEPQVL